MIELYLRSYLKKEPQKKKDSLSTIKVQTQ